MNLPEDPRNPGMRPGSLYFGYRLERILLLEDIQAVYYELGHLKTNARHIHISRNDPENTLGVAFKTIPTDSTGVAHILEHTALCGSAKFPVRDPFFSMLKRSLNTFMNAFTASDWTMYPFATQNRKDFYNLADVYMDAAFFPKLDLLSFKQEGHRMELVPENQLEYMGVVYNEMKGAMSSPDDVMIHAMLKELYPDTTYRYNSGGEPATIPSLTHEQLLDFHRRHYHPSNAYFYTYGNLPLTDHLEFINTKVMSAFDPIDPQTKIASQPRWDAPRKVQAFYPLEKSEDPADKNQVCVAWLLVDAGDSYQVLVLSLLEKILLGNAASPLRKALIDSGIGSALSDGSGFDPENQDTLFACGLKNVAASKAEEIEAVIFKTLEDLVKQGLDPKLVEAAIHQLEFRRREITNSPYPYGLRLLLTMTAAWFHGGDAFKVLCFDEHLQQIRQDIQDPCFFTKIIQRKLLDNNHRIVLTLSPDQSMASTEKARVKTELEGVLKRLTKEQISNLHEDAKDLTQRQTSFEDLSSLPTLTIADIPAKVPCVDANPEYDPSPAVCYCQPTGGIFYFTAIANLSLPPEDLLPLLPFFSFAFTKSGTAKRNYADMARQISAYTGGIGLSTGACTAYTPAGECLTFASLHAKCLDRNQTEMFSIINEMITNYAFKDLERLKSLLMEFKAGLESAIVRQGHHLAILKATRAFSKTAALREIWNGISQIQFIRKLALDFSKTNLQKLAENLEQLAGHLFCKNNLQIALVGGDKALKAAGPLSMEIFDDLATRVDTFQPGEISISQEGIREGWTTTSAVAFVAQAFKAVRLHNPDAPCLTVSSKLLRSLFLHREIREKGGAYGGFCGYNSEDGLFTFGSYRDPHIVNTLKVYAQAHDFIRRGLYTQEDVNEAILQVCSELDKPDAPGEAARGAFFRKLIKLTDQDRLAFKQRLLKVTREEVMENAERYFDFDPDQQATAVIAGEEKLNQSNQHLANPLKIKGI